MTWSSMGRLNLTSHPLIVVPCVSRVNVFPYRLSLSYLLRSSLLYSVSIYVSLLFTDILCLCVYLSLACSTCISILLLFSPPLSLSLLSSVFTSIYLCLPFSLLYSLPYHICLYIFLSVFPHPYVLSVSIHPCSVHEYFPLSLSLTLPGCVQL
jgi:hypothetical protein